MAFSACFLIEPRSTSPGMAPPTKDWALPVHHCLRKCLTAGSSGDIFSTEAPFSVITLVYCQVEKNPASTGGHLMLWKGVSGAQKPTDIYAGNQNPVL